MSSKQGTILFLTSKLFKFSTESDSVEIFEKINLFLRKELEIFGLDISSENFSFFNLRATVLYIIVVAYLLSIFYKFLFYENSFNDDIEYLLQICGLMQFVLKFLVFMKNKSIFPIIEETTETSFKKSSKISDRHAENLKEWTILSGKVIFSLISVFWLLGLCIAAATIAEYSDRNAIYRLALALIPLSMFTIFILTSQTVVSQIIVIIFNIFAQISSIMISIEQLDELIAENSKDDEKIKAKIASIVEAKIDLSNYMSLINEVFSLYYFVEMMTTIPHVAAQLNRLSYNIKYFPDYFSIIFNGIIIFTSCLSGSLIKEQHKKCFFALFHASTWSALSAKQKKMFHIMLVAFKDGSSIKCGIWDYDLQMFLHLYQSAYSYFNILLTIRNK
jgi:hypothetical protein